MCENIPVNKEMNNYINYILSKKSFKHNNNLTSYDFDNVIFNISNKYKKTLTISSKDIELIKLIRWIATCNIMGKNSSHYQKKLNRKLNKQRLR
jgi:hypothetical protein